MLRDASANRDSHVAGFCTLLSCHDLMLFAAGERPAIEPHIPAELADLISSAWATQPSLRPSFHDLLSKFNDRSRDIGRSFVAVEAGLRASDDFRAGTTP